MKIIRAEVQNFKRIELAQIEPTGEVIEVTGRNGQGKSSILDAIEAALGGKEHDPKKPIRRGQEKARVVLDLGDLIVERVWTDKTDRLVLRNREGATFSRPQERLNDLVGGLAFDPLAFMSMKPGEQRATLLRVIGVDLGGFEARRRAAFEHRTEVNRDWKAARARLQAIAEPLPDTPDSEVSIADLTHRLQEATEEQRHNEAARAEASRRESDARKAQEAVDAQETMIRALEQQLAEARLELDRCRERAEAAETVAGDARGFADALVDPEIDAIHEQIRSADAVNRLVRQKLARRTLADEVDALAKASDRDTETLGSIDDEQAQALAAAPVPVSGLGVSEDGVTLNGLPLDQASSMEQIRACTAIGAALNPKLRIALIRHGNDLDPEALSAFYAECQVHGLQAWVERISGIGADAIVIEAGRIAASTQPPTA